MICNWHNFFLIGLSFGIFGKHLARFGRHYPVLLGFVVHIGAMVIAFMNLPFKSPIGDTDEAAYLDPPSPELAIFGSFCLGLGDACYNTQIYSIIGSVFKVEFVKKWVVNSPKILFAFADIPHRS